MCSWIGRNSIGKTAYNLKEYTDLMQFPPKFQCHLKKYTKKVSDFHGTTKDHNSQSNPEEKRPKLDLSQFLTSKQQ